MIKPSMPRSLWGRAMLALGMLVLALGLFLLGRSAVNRIRLAGSYRSIVSAYPSFVIQRVAFSKYLVQGTVPDNDPHFAQLDVWLVKGSADIQFDLSRVALDERKTDWLNRILCLEYSGDGEFGAKVDVNVNPADIRKVETVKPQSYTEEELKKMAEKAALVSGAAGAFAGGVAGAAIGGSSVLPRALPYSGGIGALVGAAAGGALAGGTAYCFTDDFIAALQGAGKGPVSVMDMIAAAKPLIEMELAGTKEQNDAYRESFEARLDTVARRAGWNGVMINYGGAR